MTYNTPTSKEGTETMLSYTKMMPSTKLDEKEQLSTNEKGFTLTVHGENYHDTLTASFTDP